jgi:hypothetical protein
MLSMSDPTVLFSPHYAHPPSPFARATGHHKVIQLYIIYIKAYASDEYDHTKKESNSSCDFLWSTYL